MGIGDAGTIRPSKTIRLIVPGDLHHNLRILVAELGTTAQALVVDLIDARVDRYLRQREYREAEAQKADSNAGAKG